MPKLAGKAFPSPFATADEENIFRNAGTASRAAARKNGRNIMRFSNALGALAVGLLASSFAATVCSAADLVMWERSGGNKDMVDKLVEMWNAKNPDRHINLTYIPHAEMVAKLAQAIASGDV